MSALLFTGVVVAEEFSPVTVSVSFDCEGTPQVVASGGSGNLNTLVIEPLVKPPSGWLIYVVVFDLTLGQRWSFGNYPYVPSDCGEEVSTAREQFVTDEFTYRASGNISWEYSFPADMTAESATMVQVGDLQFPARIGRNNDGLVILRMEDNIEGIPFTPVGMDISMMFRDGVLVLVEE